MSATPLDPRVERSRRSICSAAIAEMAEVGYGAMTIESIARRAGVGKATVYRHWDGKLGIVESALNQLEADIPVPTDESIRTRIVAMLRWLAEFLAGGSPESQCLPALVSAAQYDDSVRAIHHRFSAERRQVFIDLIDEGRSRGEIAPAADSRVVTESLVAPLFYRRLLTPEPYPPGEVEAIVELVLGAESPSSQRGPLPSAAAASSEL